jgi:uncharacterized repeat protein (TIGR01451 family)
MRTQEIREMEKRVEMYRRLLIWNIVFLLGLLCWGSLQGQSQYYKPKYGKKIHKSDYAQSYFLDSKIISIYPNSNDTFIIEFYGVYGDFLTSNKVFLKNPMAYSRKIVRLRNGDYVVVLYNTIVPLSSHSILRLDSSGRKIWEYNFKSSNVDDGNIRILEDNDENLYAVCHIIDTPALTLAKSDTSHGSYDIWILKFDKQGNIKWNKSFGGKGEEGLAFCTLENSSINIFVGSKSDSSGNKYAKKKYPNPNLSEIWYMQVDTAGNKTKDRQLFGNPTAHISSGNGIGLANKGFLLHYDFYDGKKNDSICKLDSNLNIVWIRQGAELNSYDINFERYKNDSLIIFNYVYGGFELARIDSNGLILWNQVFKSKISQFATPFFLPNGFLLINFQCEFIDEFKFQEKVDWIWFKKPIHLVLGSVFPDFNANCLYNKSSEFNIPNILIHNKTENTYAITNDSIYTMYLFDRDTAVLKIINLDSNLYVACGKDSIVVDMTGKTDTSGIDFPIRSNKTGHCINITSFSSGLLRPGRWGDYQLNYQNNAFDTAYNAYIEIEVDTAAIDTIKSPYSFTLTGNVLRFNLGHMRPFGFSSVTYSIKLKTTVIIGSSHCHRAKVFPICNLYPSAVYDSSEIQPMMRCLPNDTVEFTLKNIGLKDQKDWGHSIIYVDELILKKDSFKLTVGNSRVFKYKLDTNKVFTAEVFNSNFHPVTPILIRHNDLCANRRPMIPSNPALNFSRHDEAKEYEEACTIVRGSYDPNMKSVVPVGMFSQHYTATGTELKYRLDFQNTGTDTAFKVVLIDTLSADLDIASFVPGASSHPYSIEFSGRAVKFIFDPIALVDSFKNEPLSHGYVCFKIKHKNGIAPKTKIENFVDIYFDYNAPVRTNTVFNTIFDTIQIYVPKVTDTVTDTTGKVGIQGLNKTSIMVFPNPTTDKFYLSMSEPVMDLSIELYDMQGRMIKTASSPNNQTVEVSAQGMTKGIYHIRVVSGEKLVVVKKVMVE